MTQTSLPEMHDWTLLSAEFDWASATLTVRFCWDSQAPVLTLSGVTHLEIPSYRPWGPSVSVNRAEWVHGIGSEIHTLRVEMQSGDVITADAAAFDLD